MFHPHLTLTIKLTIGFAAAVKVEDKSEDLNHQEVKDLRVLQGDSSKRENKTFFRESVIPGKSLLISLEVAKNNLFCLLKNWAS